MTSQERQELKERAQKIISQHIGLSTGVAIFGRVKLRDDILDVLQEVRTEALEEAAQQIDSLEAENKKLILKLGSLVGREPGNTIHNLQAELEREKRTRERLCEVLDKVDSALGDRLLAKGPLSKSYAHGVMQDISQALSDAEKIRKGEG